MSFTAASSCSHMHLAPQPPTAVAWLGRTVGCRGTATAATRKRKHAALSTHATQRTAARPEVSLPPALEEGWDVEWVQDAPGGDEWASSDDEDDQHADGPRHHLPAEMRYFDTAQIYVRAGDGGKGCVAFRREKFVPKGGPAGGNGGHGGNVWVQADSALTSLSSFRRQLHYRAQHGNPGGGSQKHGANSPDLIIGVPVGTIVREKHADEDAPALAELLQPGQRALLVAGGRGGRGNASFKTGRNTAPAMAEVGEAGSELWVSLEMRIVADVGIIGVPNAGKSTLLSVVSAARPKVADYPFTTLVPNLGVCELDFRTTVFADVPGLLEGAHTGHGLGHEFLRHCQRCRVLLHVIDGTSRDPLGDWKAIQQELALFSPELAAKRQVVAYNKMDVPDSSDYWPDVRSALLSGDVPEPDVLAVSAATGEGVQDLVRRVRAVLDELPVEDTVSTVQALNVTELPRRVSDDRISSFQIEADLATTPRIFTVHGAALKRFAQMTNWDYYEAALRFQKVLEAAGVNAALRKRGIREGDMIAISGLELQWSDDQSDGALYGAWLDDRRAKGRVAQGSARWPHSGG